MAAAAFPGFHITGAIHHYVAWKAIASTPVYLGTCESSPTVQFVEQFADVHDTESGSLLPFQRTEQGEMATLTCGLNRYSKQTWHDLRAAVAPARRSYFSRGRSVFGHNTVQMWMVFENYLNVDDEDAALEIGWYWPQVHLTGHEYPRLGNGQDSLLIVRGESHPWVSPINAAGVPRDEMINGDLDWILYSSDTSYFPVAVQVPQ